ncbi:hypothetical protein [Humibacter antri]
MADARGWIARVGAVAVATMLVAGGTTIGLEPANATTDVAASRPVGSPVQVRADVPAPPVQQFNAPTCEGTTPNPPAHAAGPVPDLTAVFGQRLVDYNAGHAVILYSDSGENGGLTPNCGVTFVAGVGPVSQWMYCTDRLEALCNGTDADGNLTESGVTVPGLQERPDNARLTSDQQKLVAYVLQHDLAVSPVPYGLAPGAAQASNATSPERQARQFLVWCITDRSFFDNPGNHLIGEWCDANIGTTAHQQYLAAMTSAPVLSIAAEAAKVQPGQQARFDVTTNLYEQPITVTSNASDLAVCSGDATLSGGVLTVVGTDPTKTTTITLCTTSTVATTISVALSGQVTSLDQIVWTQSPGEVHSQACQVYAILHSSPKQVSAAATIEFEAMLAESGSSIPWGAGVGALALIALGAAGIVAGLRQTNGNAGTGSRA